MAVDKKSDHYTSPANYKALDGQMRTFTYIDHDKKTKIGAVNVTPEQILKAKDEFKQSLEREIDKILALPAVNAVRNPDGLYEEFIERSEDKGIIWRPEMLREALRISPSLSHNLWISIWRASVLPQYWYESMSYEDILQGKWEAWAPK